MDSFEISSDNYDPSSLKRSERLEEERLNNPLYKRNNPERIDVSSQASSRNSHSNKTEATKENHKIGSATMAASTRWRIFFGIILIIVAAYLLIVSISYFAYGAEDQSIVQGKELSEISLDREGISNTGGPVGAWLSDLLLSRWLGLGSFIIIFYIGALGFSLVKIKRFKFWDLTYKCLLTAITLSILIGFVTYSFTSHNYWGGDHGYTVNKYLMDNAGIWGAIGVNILLVAAVALVFMRQLQSAYTSYNRKVTRRREKLAKQRAIDEARKKRRESMLTPDPIKPAAAQQPIITPVEPVIQGLEDTSNSVSSYVNQKSSELDELADIEEIGEDTPGVDISKGTSDLSTTEVIQSPDIVEIISDEDEDDNGETITVPVHEPAKEVIPHDIIDEKPAEADQKANPTIKSKEIGGREAAEPFRDIFDPTLELSRYRFPSLDLLENKIPRTDHVDLLEQEENKARLTETLRTFGVKISHIEATVGPTITRYEIIPAEGVRTRSVKSLGEDLALTLQALGVRIIAPIPGKGTIGIEVPNKDPQTVYIRNILSSETFLNFKGELPIALGTTITNDVYVADLAKLPHLLVAGATGMGKSVGLNTIITSLLYKKHPAELKFVLVDPKRVELSLYRTLERHYLAALPGEDSIITDMSKVVTVLNSLCKEMEDRLGLLQAAEVRNIKEYNTKFIAKKLNPKKHRFLPYIVLIIDEFADIILTQGKEVENPVSRLAAVARAAGIHLIIATQRPSVNVITGGIKTNIPGRMAFRVNQGVDSRTIIDQVGANLLNGKGDMLFSRDGIIDRVQGAFISTDEVKAVVDSIGDQIGYDEPYQLPEYVDTNAEGASARGGALTDRDPMFEEAGRLVVNSNSGSTTMLQRKLAIGFGRAARIMDQLEIAGVVGPAQGGKPRDVLMDMYAFERYLNPAPPTE